MNNENIYIYLVSNLLLIIGEDNGKVIKDVCWLKITGQGPAFAPLFVNLTEGQGFGRDINKKDIPIVMAEKPVKLIADLYIKVMSGESLQSKIIVPKSRLN